MRGGADQRLWRAPSSPPSPIAAANSSPDPRCHLAPPAHHPRSTPTSLPRRATQRSPDGLAQQETIGEGHGFRLWRPWGLMGQPTVLDRPRHNVTPEPNPTGNRVEWRRESSTATPCGPVRRSLPGGPKATGNVSTSSQVQIDPLGNTSALLEPPAKTFDCVEEGRRLNEPVHERGARVIMARRSLKDVDELVHDALRHLVNDQLDVKGVHGISPLRDGWVQHVPRDTCCQVETEWRYSPARPLALACPRAVSGYPRQGFRASPFDNSSLVRGMTHHRRVVRLPRRSSTPLHPRPILATGPYRADPCGVAEFPQLCPPDLGVDGHPAARRPRCGIMSK